MLMKLEMRNVMMETPLVAMDVLAIVGLLKQGMFALVEVQLLLILVLNEHLDGTKIMPRILRHEWNSEEMDLK
jgi:hypothetical protein